MRGEFIAFMKQYGVIGLVIAVIIGGKANALVSALVDGVLMPLDVLRCAQPRCDSWLYVMPKKGDPEVLRCRCGALNLNLRAK